MSKHKLTGREKERQRERTREGGREREREGGKYAVWPCGKHFPRAVAFIICEV